MENIRVFSLKTKHWVVGFIVAHGILFVLMLVTLLQESWVESEDKELGFKGNLWSVTSSDAFPMKDYIELHDEYEEDIDSSNDEDVDDEAFAIAALFGSLAFCGCYFCVYEVFSMMILIVTILVYTLFLCKLPTLFGVFISLTLSVISHVSAAIGYTALNYLTLDGDCSEFLDEDTPLPVCGRAGPGLAVAVAVLYSLCAVGNCVVVAMYYNNKKSFEARQIPPLDQAAYPGVLVQPVAPGMAIEVPSIPAFEVAGQGPAFNSPSS